MKFSKSELYERATLRVAMHIRGLWEERGTSDTRLLEAFFIPDVYTVVGKSHSFEGIGHREHVVPRRVVILECHRMLANGMTDAEIAKFIRDSVKVVMISHEECARLDRQAQLGLRQVMPPGWKFSDDIFARLSAAGIAWDPVIATSRPEPGVLDARRRPCASSATIGDGCAPAPQARVVESALDRVARD